MKTENRCHLANWWMLLGRSVLCVGLDLFSVFMLVHLGSHVYHCMTSLVNRKYYYVMVKCMDVIGPYFVP